ncbi:MAG: DNA polymerase III subunit delta' [Zavarzinella sp.]
MSWSSIVGHREHLALLERAVSRERLGHAYLFLGHQGIGKTSFARQLGKTLLCENRSGFESCDRCAACLLCDANTHPDMKLLDKPDDKSTFPLEVVQQYIAESQLKPARGNWKITIIRNIDMMSMEAGNALLKTLEEPTPKSIIIQIAQAEDGVLQTIRSRSQILHFRPLTLDQTVEVLVNQGVDLKQAQRLGKVAQGSPGVAQEYQHQEYWDFRNGLLNQLKSPIHPIAFNQLWTDLFQLSSASTADKRRIAQIGLTLFLQLIQELLYVHYNLPAGNEAEDHHHLQEIVQQLSVEQMLRWSNAITESIVQIDRMVSTELSTEWLTAQLMKSD